MRFQRTIECPFDGRYQIRLDSDQVFPKDPGNGTPAVVHGPGGATATLGCAADTGELLEASGAVHEIPTRVLKWLQGDGGEEADGFIAATSLLKRPVESRDRSKVSRFVQLYTAFNSLDELLGAKAGYRPSLDQREPEMVVIADTYDLEQSRRNDPRRAYRYGGSATAA